MVSGASNRAPSELYKDGLNREHFLPFIGLIEKELDVLTLNGPNFYAQLATPAMIAMGLDELIAWDWDEYVEKAVAYANDIPRLAALRERVKPAFDGSLLRNEPAFARAMEEAYVKMFTDWAERQAAEAA